MKSLISNYINLLTIDKLNDFGLKNDIKLKKQELEFILDMVKNNFEDILINEDKYLNLLKDKVNEDNYTKIVDLFKYYKQRYKGFLF